MFYKDIKKWLLKCQPTEAKGNSLRRIITLCCLIAALTKSKRASLNAIAEHMPDNIDLESRIKKAKRWLNNKWTDVETHFIPYIRPIICSLAKSGNLLFAMVQALARAVCV